MLTDQEKKTVEDIRQNWQWRSKAELHQDIEDLLAIITKLLEEHANMRRTVHEVNPLGVCRIQPLDLDFFVAGEELQGIQDKVNELIEHCRGKA